MQQKNKGVAGYDCITSREFKALPLKLLVTYFYLLFKGMINSKGLFHEWKIGVIGFLSKPGKDLTKPGSWRPISLLLLRFKIFSSLVEKAVSDDLQGR